MWESWWGTISNGISKVQRDEISRRCAYVAYGRWWGLVKSQDFLATTGRGNGRWDGRQLKMTQDARDHRLMSDDGNDAQ